MRTHPTRAGEKQDETALPAPRQPFAPQAVPERAGPADTLLGFQSTHGNLFVQRLLSESAPGHEDVSPDAEQAIQQTRGNGHVLQSGVRRDMESAFGADFGDVRVHTDTTADSLNRSLSAVAFTTGQDVYFRQGAFDPEGPTGRRLLAHELTHVVQQAGSAPQGKLVLGPPGDALEQEAERTADAVVQKPTHAMSPQRAVTGDAKTVTASPSHGVVQGARVQRYPPGPETETETETPSDPTTAPSPAPVADPTHKVEVWIDYNNTLKKAGGKPEARGPNSALYVEDIRMLPNKMGIDPKGYHFSGINVASSGGAKLGVIDDHPEADGLVSGVVKFGTTPSVKLDATITYIGDDVYEPLSPEAKKALEPTMKAAKKDAAKVAQKALTKLGDADEETIKGEVEAELRTAYTGLDFKVLNLVPQGTGEAFTLPSVPYDAVLADTLMKLWVNVPATGFTHRYDYESIDKAAVSKETSTADSTTDITKSGGTSGLQTSTIDKVVTELEVDLKNHIKTDHTELKTKNETRKWTIGAKMKEELKGSLGGEAKGSVDLGSLIPIAKIPLVGKLASKLGVIPKLPVELKLKADGSGEWSAEQNTLYEKWNQETETYRDQTVTDWGLDVNFKQKNESYKQVNTSLTAYWDVYHKEEKFKSQKDAAALEATRKRGGSSVSITYKAGQPFLTVGGPATEETKIVS